MGLMDKAKSVIGRGNDDGGIPEAEEDWGADVVVEEDDEGDIDDEFGEPEEGTEDLEQTWDSAYDFVGDNVTKAGFTDMKDFIEHCMFYKIQRSPLYRDRIQSGVEAMNQITSMKQSMEEIQGDSQMDLKGKAEQIKAANEVMDEMEQLKGEDEEFLKEVTGLAREYADILRENQVHQGGGVDASVSSEETGERL